MIQYLQIGKLSRVQFCYLELGSRNERKQRRIYEYLCLWHVYVLNLTVLSCYVHKFVPSQKYFIHIWINAFFITTSFENSSKFAKWTFSNANSHDLTLLESGWIFPSVPPEFKNWVLFWKQAFWLSAVIFSLLSV